VCGTFFFYSFIYLSCGVVIFGTFEVCLVAYTIVGTTLTIVGNVDGSILPLIIFCALTFVLSCSLYILEHEAPPSSTMFFLLQTFLESLLQPSFYFLVLFTSFP
jgi:hypothetical protein